MPQQSLSEQQPRPNVQSEIVRAAFALRDPLMAYAYGMVRDWARSEDVLQEALVVVVKKWEDAPPLDRIYPWVQQIVHFKALESARASGRNSSASQQKLAQQVAQTLSEGMDEASAVRDQQQRKALRTCMAELNVKAQTLLTNFYWDQQNTDEIGRIQKRSGNAVRLSLSRIRKSLEECVGRTLGAQESA